MNDIFAVCSGVVGVVLISSVLRRIAPDWAALVGVCLGLFVLRRTMGILYPVSEYVKGLWEASEYSSYMTVAVKALGIAVVTHITCETCRDLGENAVAAKVELCGKAAILLCAIPVMKEIFSYVNSFLQP